MYVLVLDIVMLNLVLLSNSKGWCVCRFNDFPPLTITFAGCSLVIEQKPVDHDNGPLFFSQRTFVRVRHRRVQLTAAPLRSGVAASSDRSVKKGQGPWCWNSQMEFRNFEDSFIISMCDMSTCRLWKIRREARTSARGTWTPVTPEILQRSALNQWPLRTYWICAKVEFFQGFIHTYVTYCKSNG